MADREDEIMEGLAHSISFIYTMLVDICGALPVRIGLPADQHIPASDAVPAIKRVSEVAHDQPMGELQTMQLYSGCIHLLAAIDLYALCASRYEDTRAEGAGVNLLHAEQELKSLALWLVINEAD
ncbi:hypothetical protein [Streptomyces sp. NPDC005760]|uniref:hypothetical protein n=1 Tax=Streptomyces sp. NPDC005760 TaxID=3156718 RepID=UPI000F505A4E